MTSYLEGLPVTPDAFGLTHNDLHLANFCVSDTTATAGVTTAATAGATANVTTGVTIFDFDDCAYGWYMMDIAMLLFDLLTLTPATEQEKGDVAVSFVASFLSGYRSQKEISAFWLEQLPHFLKLLELNYYVVMMKYFPGGNWGWWGDLFMPGRRRRIVNDVPFVNLDKLLVDPL